MDLLVVSGSSSKNRDRWSRSRSTMGSTSTATSTSTTAVNVKAQVDVHRTLAHLRQGPTLDRHLFIQLAARPRPDRHECRSGCWGNLPQRRPAPAPHHTSRVNARSQRPHRRSRGWPLAPRPRPPAPPGRAGICLAVPRTYSRCRIYGRPRSARGHRGMVPRWLCFSVRASPARPPASAAAHEPRNRAGRDGPGWPGERPRC